MRCVWCQQAGTMGRTALSGWCAHASCYAGSGSPGARQTHASRQSTLPRSTLHRDCRNGRVQGTTLTGEGTGCQGGTWMPGRIEDGQRGRRAAAGPQEAARAQPRAGQRTAQRAGALPLPEWVASARCSCAQALIGGHQVNDAGGAPGLDEHLVSSASSHDGRRV